MGKNEHFKYLAKNSSLMIFGEDPLQRFEDVFSTFKQSYYLEPTPYTIDNLIGFMVQMDINILIISKLSKNIQLCEKINILLEQRKTKIILSLDINDKDNLCDDLINISDMVFTTKIDPIKLQEKLFDQLTNCSHIQLDNLDNKNITKRRYKDAFDLKIIGICEELRVIVGKIDSGDVSTEVIQELYLLIQNISNILDQYLMISKVIVNVIKDLEKYLNEFNIESIDVSNIEGFEHLARLIEDIAVFLDKYFITKQINDIYIVEDSLENSFRYVQLVFEGKKDSDADDGSELEFF